MAKRPFTMALVISEYRGIWSATVNYYAGDLLKHLNKVYLALKKSKDIEPPNAEYYKLFFEP